MVLYIQITVKAIVKCNSNKKQVHLLDAGCPEEVHSVAVWILTAFLHLRCCSNKFLLSDVGGASCTSWFVALMSSPTKGFLLWHFHVLLFWHIYVFFLNHGVGLFLCSTFVDLLPCFVQCLLLLTTDQLLFLIYAAPHNWPTIFLCVWSLLLLTTDWLHLLVLWSIFVVPHNLLTPHSFMFLSNPCWFTHNWSTTTFFSIYDGLCFFCVCCITLVTTI